MNNHKYLKLWQKSVDLALKIYEVTIYFLKEEFFGLLSQTRKSAVSIQILLKVLDEIRSKTLEIFTAYHMDIPVNPKDYKLKTT